MYLGFDASMEEVQLLQCEAVISNRDWFHETSLFRLNLFDEFRAIILASLATKIDRNQMTNQMLFSVAALTRLFQCPVKKEFGFDRGILQKLHASVKRIMPYSMA